MTAAWFDCSAGAAGDMILGALLDAGASLAAVQRAVEAVAPGAVRVRVETVRRCGLAATRVHVDTEPGPPHRTWHDIRATLAGATLAEPVRERALAVFSRLARAEAAAHGVPADDVHFHEVGALDAIADVVGVCAAVHELGVGPATATPLTLGSGSVPSAHGRLPVPAPAVLRLLAEHGAPARSGGFPYEMATPTGVALVLTLCSGWGGLPPLRVLGTGSGAGARDLAGVPNVVRVVLGSPLDDDAYPGTEAVVVDANVDDLDPRIWPQVLARLLSAGAADAWLTPVLMKKGRPAHVLSVLCSPQALADVRETIVAETSTIGSREYRVRKRELAREFTTVAVGTAEVRVKVARHRGRIVNVQPEYEDVVAAADRLGVPVKAALARSIAAAAQVAEVADVADVGRHQEQPERRQPWRT
ncbi:nickel pincer cofactor biosynthesis protein LarC [Nonomuraea sp. NN258]|uniref:nickel pincer cofactor biosynthesis protein LarC n=1 Tax=Nonomuraea antri TaxID=2730852 RepID=UPI00156A57A8|nr:nickel pincer cofactor biosynthesis protein LarC [Nonomuraea antri]NRQ30937.1 nickel pincer cofactor biosynthesis protein LarC [Nonomuraea antri]